MSSYDAIIVGGGPAGASCAIWLKLLGFRACIVDTRASLGGLQNESPYPNDWIAPVVGLRGQDVASSIHRHVAAHDIETYLETSVLAATKRGETFVVEAERASGRLTLEAPYLVAASGVRPADGGMRAAPNFLIGPGRQIAQRNFAGQSVAVLGGGDSAFENYEFIRDRGADDVHIYARTLCARREFLERVPARDVRIGSYEVDPRALSVSGRRYDVIVVLYGWTPALDYMDELLPALNARGFVATDLATCETSVPNMFAIGEVAHRMHPCCVTSMADGVVTAKEIQKRIEADAKEAFIAATRLAAVE